MCFSFPACLPEVILLGLGWRVYTCLCEGRAEGVKQASLILQLSSGEVNPEIAGAVLLGKREEPSAAWARRREKKRTREAYLSLTTTGVAPGGFTTDRWREKGVWYHAIYRCETSLPLLPAPTYASSHVW